MSYLLASIVVNNRNYGRFVGQAIESALNQTYPALEVIVVDDGSTDDSREVIARYGDRVKVVFKENGGQASAFNAGLTASRGDLVLFLDSDDLLLPGAVETAAASFTGPEIAKAHWRLRIIDENGEETGQLTPGGNLAEGDLREDAFRLGPTQFLSAPTSGNAWSRSFLESIFPVPDLFRQGADTYLFELAPFLGTVRKLREPLSLYRVHGGNYHGKMTLEYKIRRQMAFYDACVSRLQAHFGREGRRVDVEKWKRNSWWHRQALALEELARLPKPDMPLIVVDEAAWEKGPIAGRRRIPFLEKDGCFNGSPADDDTAIRELERLRHSGAGFLAFAWPAFWWLDYYPEFHRHLKYRYRILINNDRLVVFEL
jgi:glycosyltransferase involved in cell wall biosynthesis